MQAHLSPSEVVLDESPKLHWLEGSVAHLTIPSFRGDHFFKQKWTPIVEGLSKVRRLIVDLRGNRGGNFVAMLRALSTFYCGVAEAGRLYQSRRQAGTVLKFLDDVDQDVQLSVVDRAQEVNLVTFPGYGCYRGSVVVLVDEGTSSVSEIFAQALKEKNKVQIMGQRTAGDVLLAVIYPLTQLGGDYSLYVPQMNFMSLGGHRIERAGVEPQYTLDYRLDEAEKGVDSWIQRALEKGP
jgi:carboxyl-terminal processing protease